MSDDKPIDEEELLRQWQEAAGNFDPNVLMNQMDVDSFFVTDAPAPLKGIDILISPPTVKHERLYMMETIFNDMSHFLMNYLRHFLNTYVEVVIAENDIVRFGRYLEGCPLPTMFNIYQIAPWNTMGIVRVDSTLLYSLLNVSLGGRTSGLAIRGKIEGRAFTSFELSLARVFTSIVLQSFSQSFSRVTKIICETERQEILPKFCMIVPQNQMAIVGKIKIDFEKIGGIVDIVLPLSSIEPVWPILSQTDAGDKGVDNLWQSHFSQELYMSSVAMTCKLPPIKSTLNEVLSLDVGSTILFDPRFVDNVDVIIEDKLFAKGKMGKKRGKMAVKLK